MRDSLLEAMEKIAELDLRRMLVKDDAGKSMLCCLVLCCVVLFVQFCVCF